MALDDASLAEVGRLYREGRLKLAEIGRPYGLAPSAISHLARVHGWPMRRKLKARAPQVTALSTPKTRALARRLCDAITKKLEHMEKGMTSGELSSADYERDAKAVGSMVGGLQKVAATVKDAERRATAEIRQLRNKRSPRHRLGRGGAPSPRDYRAL